MTKHSTEQAASAEKYIHAYKKMLERVKDMLQGQGGRARNLAKSVEAAKEEAVAQGELRSDEADTIGRFVARDLREAGRHLAATGSELRTWLGIDIQLMEDWLLDMFAQAADKTKLELMQLEQSAREAVRYHTGEIAGPGALRCDACGEVVNLYGIGHVPPCPKCHGTVFSRSPDSSPPA